MNRRSFLNSAGGSALAGAFSRKSKAAASARPNILIITTDQQSADAMSCRIGNRYIKTPNMDSLAENGTVFRRAYCANPLCIPSRTSMYTGRYPAETGIQTNDKATIDLSRFPLMGSLFRRAGYTTGYFGKWHLPFDLKNREAHGFTDSPALKGDGNIAEEAAEFLRGMRGKTFLAVASFVNPHNICQWARREKLPDGDVGTPPPLNQCPPRRPNFAPPRDETDTMAMMRRSYHNTRTFPVGNFSEKDWREYIWGYYRMTELVDGLVGQVLQSLRQTGLEENTLVVFLADHGDCQGAHGFNQKTVFYDEAAAVPCILSHKGVTRRGFSDRLVHTGVDLIPTLCDYAGIPIPAGLPGMSLRDTANGKTTADPREYLVVSNHMVQGGPVDGRTPKPAGRMVRSQRYKYCVYSEGKRRESLVDMEKDPGEMTNLAADSRYQDVLRKHRGLLADFQRKTGDKFPAPGAS